MSRLIALLCLISFSTQLCFAAVPKSYIVKKGDNLSSIAYHQISKNVYGKTGSLSQLVRLNPHIANPELIFPGTRISLEPKDETLSMGQEDASRSLAQVSDTTVVVEKKEEAKSFNGFSLIEASPRFFYTRIDGLDKGNGTKATLLSNLNYGLNLAWRQIWTESFESFLGVGVAKVKFSDSATRTLDGAALNQSELELGGKWHLSKTSSLQFSLAASDEIFYRATAPTNLKIEPVMIPRMNLDFIQTFYTHSPFTLGGELKLSIVSSAKTDSYDIKPGYGYIGRLFVIQAPANSSLKLSGGSFFGQRFQNTSGLKLKRSDIGLDFALTWSFGK